MLVLVQWSGLAPEDASWEKWDDLCENFHLEDKVSFPADGSVSKPNITESTSPITEQPQSKRISKRPTYLKDYV